MVLKQILEIIWIYNINNTEAQEFEIEKVSDGYYKIESKLSGKVLDVANGSRTAGANVWQYSWNGSDAQLWRFVDAGDGKILYTVKNWVLY